MPTVSIHMPEQSGQTGLTLFLRKTSDGTLLNAGGDGLTEDPESSGRFVATVAETHAEIVAASVTNAGSLTVRDGWLAVGGTIVVDGYPSSDPPTAGAIADAVWDESRSGHTTAGTFGFYLDAAVSGVGGNFTVDAAGAQLIVDAMLAQGPTLYTALTADETTLRIGDEYVQEFTGLGSLVGRSNIAFAIKTRKTDADTAALIYLTETGGLTRVNGAA